MLINLFLGICYKILLDYIYIFRIAPFGWGYQGLSYNQDCFAYLFGWLCYIILFVLIQRCFRYKYEKREFSYVVMLVLLLTSFIPGIVMYGAGVFDLFYYFCFLFLWCNIFLVYYSISRLKVVAFRNRVKVMFLILPTLAIVTILYIFLKFGFTFHDLDILSVYEQRSIWKRFLPSLPLFVKYILANVAVINIFAISYFYHKRNYAMVAFMILIQYMQFSFGGEKTILFATFMSIIIFYCYKFIAFRNILIMLNLALVCCICIDVFCGNKIFISIVRRIMFIPNLLSYNYFEFFLNNSPIYYVVNQYNGLPNIIADIYHNKPSMSANNGIMSDAVANLSFIGIFIYPIILNVFLKILDITSYKVPSFVKISVAILIVVTLQNSFMATSMLSHGFFVAFLLFSLYPKTE